MIDDKIGFGVSPSPSSFRISGTYRGEEAVFRAKVTRLLNELKKKLSPSTARSDERLQIAPELLRTLPAPSNTSLKSLDWLASLADQWGGPLAQPLSGYDAHDNFYAKSILVPESTPLTVCSLFPSLPFSHHHAAPTPPLKL